MQEQNAATVTPPTEEVKVQAKNFAELRSIAEAAREENAKLKQYVSKLEEKINKKQTVDEDDENVSTDPYIDDRRLKREMGRFAESLESKIDKKAEEKARQLIAEEKRNDYLKANTDFNDIMQTEVLGGFVSKHPRVAEIMQKMPDTFERQQLVYETIKMIKSLEPEKKAETPAQPRSPLQQAFDSRNPRLAYQPGGNAGGAFAWMGDFSQGGMKNSYEKFKALQKTVNL